MHRRFAGLGDAPLGEREPRQTRIDHTVGVADLAMSHKMNEHDRAVGQSYVPKTSTALCPPKPNELLITTCRSRSLGSFGT